VEQVGDNCHLQFDIYHTAMMGDEPSATLEKHFGIVRHIQFADAPGRGEPGTGNIALQKHFTTIERLGYQGWVSAEYRPTKPTPETIDWLRRTS
jgi:hydroxypyruvate isomerase